MVTVKRQVMGKSLKPMKVTKAVMLRNMMMEEKKASHLHMIRVQNLMKT